MDDRQRTHYCMHDGKSSTDPLPTLRQEMKAMRRLLLAAGLALALPAQATEIIVLAAPTTVGSQYSDLLYGKALGFFAEEGVDLQLAGFTGGSAVVVPQLACAVSARAVPRVAPHSASAARPARHQRLRLRSQLALHAALPVRIGVGRIAVKDALGNSGVMPVQPLQAAAVRYRFAFGLRGNS